MKKILAIVLVIAMVLIPVSALAATVSELTVLSEKQVGATGTLKYYNAADTSETTTVAYDKAAIPTNTDVFLGVTVPEGFKVSKVEAGTGATAAAAEAALADKTSTLATGTYALGTTGYFTAVKVTYVASNYAVKGAIIGNKNGNPAILYGFGSVATSVSGDNITFKANVLNAYWDGTWKIAVSDTLNNIADVTTGDPWYVSGIGTANLVLSASKLKTAYGVNDMVVYVGPSVNPQVGTITGTVDKINKFGKVNVHWLTADSAKVTATPNKGAKFIGWVLEENTIGPIDTAAAPDWDLTKNVIIVTGLKKTDNVALIAHFINVSGGDFTTSTTDTRTNGDNPKTGDNSNIALWSIVGIIALGGVALASKKVFSK